MVELCWGDVGLIGVHWMRVGAWQSFNGENLNWVWGGGVVARMDGLGFRIFCMIGLGNEGGGLAVLGLG